MYRAARQACGLSREEAAFRLHIGSRTLANYESGETVPPPEVVLAMSKLYQQPWLTQHYCRRCCAIGEKFSYEILNNVDLSFPGIILSLQEELREAAQALEEMLALIRNKRARSDFRQDEWRRFSRCLHEFLDVEHNIEVLKIELNRLCDVAELIEEHNAKCYRNKYAVAETKKRELATVASS